MFSKKFLLAIILVSLCGFFYLSCAKKKKNNDRFAVPEENPEIGSNEQPAPADPSQPGQGENSSRDIKVKLVKIPESISSQQSFTVTVLDNRLYDAYAFRFGVSRFVNCQEEIGYSPSQTASQSFSLDLSQVNDGEIKLCLAGTKNDKIIFTSISVYTWIKDTQSPIIGITPETFTSSKPKLVAVTANESVFLSWSKKHGSGNVTLAEQSDLSYLVSADTYGPYTISVEATDLAGNKASADFTFYWGLPGPSMELATAYYTREPLLLTPVIDNAETYLWQVTSGPGQGIISSPTTKNTVFSAAVEGSYDISLTATNSTGNASTISTRVIWDVTPPELSQLSLINDAVDGIISEVEATTSSQNLIALPRTNESTTIKYKLVESGTICDGNIIYSGDIPATSSLEFNGDGIYYICLEIMDLAGNISYFQTPSIILDTSAPQTLLVNGLPDDPSIATNFELFVTGEEVHYLRSKIGAASVITCDDPQGYSQPFLARDPYAVDIGNLANQRITLCLVAGDLVENFMPYSAAFSATWTNDSSGPAKPVGFTATPYTLGNRLKWQNNDPDALSYLLIRRTGAPVNFSPTAGVAYAVGMLSDGEHEVITNEIKSEIFDKNLNSNVSYHYALFSHDALYNYSSSDVLSLVPTQSSLFNLGKGFNGTIRIIKTSTYGSGGIYFGGDFTVYEGTLSQRLIRFLPDFTVDESFGLGSGFNSSIYDIAEDSSGILYLGGSFTVYNGTGSARIVSLNNDGTKNTSFNMGSGFNGTVYALAIDHLTGDIYAAGAFTNYNGSPANRIVRINSDGTIDNFFNTGVGFNNTVYALSFDSLRNRLCVGGQFTSYNGIDSARIICLKDNGAVETSFDYGSGTNNIVYTLLLDELNEKLYAGGQFTSYQSLAAGRIMRLNLDGSLDNGFAVGSAFNNIVRTLSFGSSHDEIFVGGNFTTYQGLSHRYLAKIFSDGSEDSLFQAGQGFDNTPLTIAYTSQNEVLWGGSFVSYQGDGQSYALATDVAGSRLDYFSAGTGFNNTVYQVLSSSPKNEIYAFGAFTMYNGTVSNRLVKLDKNGAVDTNFNIGGGLNNIAYAAALDPQSQSIYVGGAFTSYSGIPSSRILALTPQGAIDQSFFADTGFNNSVFHLSFDSQQQKLYAGGRFTTYKTLDCPRICRLSTNGDRDPTFQTGTGFNNDVWSILSISDGSLYVAGAFTEFNGQSAGRIIKLQNDGSIDTDFNPGSGANGAIYALLQDEEGIWVGGAFTNINGFSFNRLSKLTNLGDFVPDLNLETGFNNSVLTLTLDPFNKNIFVGGQFSTFKGQSANRLVSLNLKGEKNDGFIVETGFNSDVRSILADDSLIYAAGAFSSYQNRISSQVIKISPDGSRE